MKQFFSLPKNLYVVGAIVLLITTYFSIGSYSNDEHTQVLEFANYKLGGAVADELPWEHKTQMRPTIQPGLLYGTHKILEAIGLDSPYVATFLMRLLAAILSFLSVHLLFLAYKPKIPSSKLQNGILLLGFLCWFIVFNNVRFSSENLSGTFMALSIGYFLTRKHRGKVNYLLLGVLLGFVFLFRYQVGFMVFGFGLWLLFIERIKLIHAGLLLLGIIAVAGLGVLIDYWFYGEWTLSAWNYFDQNLLQDKVSGFGKSPWYWYFESTFNSAIPPFSLLFILSPILLVIFRFKSLLTWTIIPFILIHFAIGHKEIRFLFPLLAILPVIVITVLQECQNRWPKFFAGKWTKVPKILFWIVNSIVLIAVAFGPADRRTPVSKFLGDLTEESSIIHYKDSGMNPFEWSLPANYFKPDNFESEAFKSFDELQLNDGRRHFVIIKNKDPEIEKFAEFPIVYASIPKWATNYNVGGWVERTPITYIIELSETTSTNL